MALLSEIKSVSITGGSGTLPLKDGESEFKPSGYKREHKAGSNARDGGYTRRNEPASLKLVLLAQPHLDLQALNAVEGENITINMKDGSTHLMAIAWCEDVAEQKDGEITLNFMANVSEKIK